MRSTGTSFLPSSSSDSVSFTLTLLFHSAKPFSQISEIHKLCRYDDDEESNPSDSPDLLLDCALHVQVTRVFSNSHSHSYPHTINLFTFFNYHSFVQNTVQQIVSEFSDFDSLGISDFGNSIKSFHFRFPYAIYVLWILTCVAVDTYIEHLQKELNNAEVETTNVATEIEHLAKTNKDG